MSEKYSIRFVLIVVSVSILMLTMLSPEVRAYTCPGTDADAICGDGIGPENDPLCDSDSDGYLDTEECGSVISLPDPADPNMTVTYSYTNCVTDPESEFCMNPVEKDLFLIVIPSDEFVPECSGVQSLLPADLLNPTTNPVSLKGLGLRVHTIKLSQAPTLDITGSSQKAVEMIEECSTSNDYIAGDTTRGTPPEGIVGSVFSYNIQKKIYDACGCTSDGLTCTKNCYISYDGTTETLTDADSIVADHIVHTFNHELGHTVNLSVNYSSKIGHHWKAGTGAELDQFVDCKAKGSKVTCYISEFHADPDISGFRLK